MQHVLAGSELAGIDMRVCMISKMRSFVAHVFDEMICAL
jgi:hypothetical protein